MNRLSLPLDGQYACNRRTPVSAGALLAVSRLAPVDESSVSAAILLLAQPGKVPRVLTSQTCEGIPQWGIVFELEFIETSGFSAIRDEYLSDIELHLLQLYLMANPEAGSLIRGTGGVRKLRWGTESKGKRGGLRVIYYWITHEDQILLITVYRKSETTDLSRTAIKQIRKMIRDLR